MKNALMISILLMAGTLWAGTYSGGAGTQASPYRISTVANWQELMFTSGDWNKHFILTADINFNGAPITQVGTSSTPFNGFFDGGGKKLQNFIINHPHSDCVGLFGLVGSGGEIRNLGVESFNVIGRYYVGGIVGYNRGTIDSCYTTGSVMGSTYYVGGLVGRNSDSGTIDSCYATGSVKGSSSVGGLVGQNNGTITFCYATGSVEVTGDEEEDVLHVGGLVGGNSGTIDSCYAMGMVTGNSNQVGGLVGSNFVSSTIVSCYATGAVKGSSYVGGLVGVNFNGSTIDSCYATGSVKGSSSVGGLVGSNYGPITSCYATGDVKGGGGFPSSVGGLVGGNSGTIDSCYATGSVTGSGPVGGLVGHNSGPITSCFAAGPVTGNSLHVGGLVGWNSDGGTISSCYSTGSVSGIGDYVGGLVGYNPSGSITSCYFLNTSGPNNGFGTPLTDSQMRQQSSFPSWDFVDAWVIREGMTYPHLNFLEGQGTQNDPYLLYSPGDLFTVGFQNYYWDKHFILMKDLDLSGLELRPIGNGETINGFTGTFDGNRHVLRNLRIVWPEDEPNNVGLFGYISGASAEVRKLGLENVRIGTSSNRAGNNVGGLVGTLADGAHITECYVSDGSVSTDSIQIYGSNNVGGLIGLITGTSSSVTNCYVWSAGELSRLSSNDGNVGGLVGQMVNGKVSRCYAKGHNAETLAGTSKGWIAGSNSGTVEESYYNPGPINGVGTWEENLDLLDSYGSLWDFVPDDDRSFDGHADIWYMLHDGMSYIEPRFWWQHPERRDINCDYTVDVKDFMTLSEEWLADEDSGFPRLGADINNDRIVNIEDFGLLAEKWNENVPQ